MRGTVLRVMQHHGSRVDDLRSLASGGEAHFVHPMDDARLLFAGHIHDVEGEQFAGDPWEAYVEVDFHLLACCRKNHQTYQHEFTSRSTQ
jgi:hypothetical protein